MRCTLRLLSFRLAFALFALMVAQSIRAENETPKIAAKIRRVVEASEFQASYPDSHLYGASQCISLKDLDEALPAAVRLWISRQSTAALYVTWWEQRERHVRLLIAFLLCGEDGDRPDEMRFELPTYADRFAEPERTQRKEELDYVIAHRKEMGRWFKEKLLPAVGKKRLAGFTD